MPNKTAKFRICAVHLHNLLGFYQTLMAIHYSWKYNYENESAFALTPITCALSSLPKLKDVTILIEGGYSDLGECPLPPLRSFRNLSSLSVTCSLDMPAAYCDQEITSVIEASPELVKLCLRNFCIPVSGQSAKTCASLQRFVGWSWLRLVKLELQNVPLLAVGLERTLSRNLRELTVHTPPGSRRVDFS